MAIAAGTFWEVENGGSDTANGGGFNPANASFATDLTTTGNGNTSTPTVSSASYNFVAADVGAWVFIQSGTNWLAGWYKITSVGSNQATLDAAIGHGVLWSSPSVNGLSTQAGVSTVATPTNGVWGVDYSQQTTAVITFADITTAGVGATFTSAANPVGKNFVGNIIQLTGGTNITTGFYEIISTAATTGTCDRNISSGVSTNGVGGLGGALASMGQSGANHVAGNKIWIKYNAAVYTISSATNNTAGGCLSMTAGVTTTATELHGYNTYRTDLWTTFATTRPTLQAGSITAFTMVTVAADCVVSGLIFDCQTKTTSRGLTGNSSARVYFCKATNATNNGFSTGNYYFCETSGCTTTAGSFATCNLAFACVASANTVTGFFSTGQYIECLSINNTGGATRGFDSSSNSGNFVNCTAYGNGEAGFRCTAGAVTDHYTNCLAINNTGKAFDISAAGDNSWYFNCAVFGNASPQVSASITPGHVVGLVTLSANPFVNAGGSYSIITDAWANFLPNTTSGGGLSIRGAALGP